MSENKVLNRDSVEKILDDWKENKIFSFGQVIDQILSLILPEQSDNEKVIMMENGLDESEWNDTLTGLAVLLDRTIYSEILTDEAKKDNTKRLKNLMDKIYRIIKSLNK